ncbi:unnamed protein product, partial [Rotaria magnacalcarata]
MKLYSSNIEILFVKPNVNFSSSFDEAARIYLESFIVKLSAADFNIPFNIIRGVGGVWGV